MDPVDSTFNWCRKSFSISPAAAAEPAVIAELTMKDCCREFLTEIEIGGATPKEVRVENVTWP